MILDLLSPVDIQQEYTRLGLSSGWRFLYNPLGLLEKSPKVLFLGINPGGDSVPPEHGVYSTEAGSAYVVESWAGAPPGQSGYQQAVRKIFAMLNYPIEEAVTGCLIPFRSRKESDLGAALTPAKKFGVQLWSPVIRSIKPKLIVTTGRTPYKGVSTIMAHLCSSETTVSLQGNSPCSLSVRRGDDWLLIGLPYPSKRFDIFNNACLRKPVQDCLYEARTMLT
ncbi:uracil-DNA glycosylase family protein [Synechococcus sp. CCAP 1479/9]|uniref:uracil-DNA glycosylase family protein n=1 Tax=Synechococcus sp. CCAP 1479/9 TaxID=1221593 RepID=UPI001C2336B2|nr:uracil-DNA glycosylase family protein [Synechococcus sp. CCAP 1479/9]